ncbi:MAG: thiol-disulfide oxidoreductase DCC family protein [Bacteroidia bacterium]
MSKAKELPTVYYDGDCGMCQGWVRHLQRWDTQKKLQYHPIQTAPPGIPRDAVSFSYRGKLYVGPDAVTQLLRFLRRKELWLWLLVPYVLRKVIYRLLSRYRYTSNHYCKS